MITFTCKTFADLTVYELYDLLKLRQQVFAVEQNCVYLDVDGRDPYGLHCLGKNEEQELVAYTRLLPMDVPYPGYVSIGRVVTAATARGGGLGRQLMRYSLAQIEAHFGQQPIKIGAQTYLLDFYKSLGFKPFDAPYLDDGIEHIKMILLPTPYNQ
jgi:ElaA protein